MRLSDFILLEEEKKKLVVLHDGVLIAKRSNSLHMMFLFQLDTFYVETYCNLQNKAIEEYRVFDNTRSLTPYLELIPIADLFNHN
jgi:hypothetical protein